MSDDLLRVKLRQARGKMSLDEAAERSGVTAKRIQMYEEGHRHPYRKTLVKLAETYGVPVKAFIPDELPRTTPRVPGRRRGRPRKYGSGASSEYGEPSIRPVRRRRRRVVSANEESLSQAVEVPFDPNEDRVIRLVLEVIIRPKHAQRAEPEEGDDVEAAGEAERRSQFTAEVRTRPAEPNRPATDGDRPDASGPVVRRMGGDSQQRAIFRGQRPEIAAGGVDGSGDPLAPFREAYREFRKDKR